MTTPAASNPTQFVFQAFSDQTGLPLAGGLLYTYISGTTTPQATYTDATGVYAAANPLILNPEGKIEIWLNPNYDYRLDLWDATHTYEQSPYPIDNVFTNLNNQPTVLATLASTTLNTGGAGAIGYNSSLVYPNGSVGAELNSLPTYFTTSQGAGLVGYNSSLAYPANTVGAGLNASVTLANLASTTVGQGASLISDTNGANQHMINQASVSIFNYMTPAQYTSWIASPTTYDVTTIVQSALTSIGASGGGTLFFPAGTFLCSANLNVPVGQTSAVNILGSGWNNGGLLFTGSAVTTGLTFSAVSGYSYCGSVQNIKIGCTSGAVTGVTFVHVWRPKMVECWVNGATGVGIYFNYTILGRLEHTMVANCGSATAGQVEVDNSTCWMWDHSDIETSNVGCIGGLRIDRTSQAMVLGGDIESTGIPIMICSKSEGSISTVHVVILGVDLENAGDHYIEAGYGWTGGVYVGVRNMVLDSISCNLSGSTTTAYGVKIKNSTSTEIRACDFTNLYPGVQVTPIWQEGNTNTGLIVRANRFAVNAGSIPWVMTNGAAEPLATPYSDFNYLDQRAINQTISISNGGAALSLSLGTQGGFGNLLKITNASPQTVTSFTPTSLASEGRGVVIYVQAQDSNTTFGQQSGSYGQLQLKSGANTTAVSGLMYQFVSDGKYWCQV